MNTEQEEKELERLISTSYIRTGGHIRCVICNCVSSETIETNLGDYKSNMSFVQDTKHKESHICITCREVIDDTILDYEFQDELNKE